MAFRPVHALVAATALAAPAAPAADAPPSYLVRVRVEPEAGAIDARAEIACAPCPATFSLARDLGVRRVFVDGRPVEFTEAAPAAGASARDVTLAAPATPRRLAIEYGGPLRASSYPPLVRQVNHVRGERVELASYAAWYPRLGGQGAFSFRLVADLPSAFVAVTNGRRTRSETKAGRVVTEWESGEPAGDIVLVAAPGLRARTATADGGVLVELWSAALPREYAEAMTRDVARAAGVVAGLVGTAPPSKLVRVVYAPRPGWGYVRRPLIVVSEEGALAQIGQPFGRARDLRYVTHEIAHYWWQRADAGTPEDWLNEGLAEYTAWLAAESLSGREFADQLLAEYRQRSADSATTAAIAQTENGSPDREVNRYARPVLVLEEARRRYGSEAMAAFLRALYRRFAAPGPATTAAFLDEAGLRLGAEAKERFSEALYRKRWADEARPKYVYSARDAVFLGTWTGSLTQAGATNKVVLHLVEKDGGLVATLDSPDQGVAGIVVPTVGVSGGELSFGLGNFGVSYRGVLSEDLGAIAGEWTQGGTATPLTLRRAAPFSDP